MKASSGILYMFADIHCSIYTPFLDRLKKIYGAMDRKYKEAADYYGFKCTGCEDNCCLTRFYHYTLLEYLYIKEGFHCLENEQQVEVKKRSMDVCRKSDESDQNGKPVRLMCPLNVENLCSLYAYRPMICRLHGIPHELQRPGQGILKSPGCGSFAVKYHDMKYVKFDRTPFYMQMAALEKEIRQEAGLTQKVKMTVAKMIVSFGDR